MYIPLEAELSLPPGTGITQPADIHTAAKAMFNSAEFMATFGSPNVLTNEEREKARAVIMAKMDYKVVQESSTAIYLRSLVADYDHIVAKSAEQMRTYVTNALIEEAAPGAKNRIKALELLGKISEVGLFTERTEITVRHQSSIELETRVREKLARLMGKPLSTTDIEVNATPVVQHVDPDLIMSRLHNVLLKPKDAKATDAE